VHGGLITHAEPEDRPPGLSTTTGSASFVRSIIRLGTHLATQRGQQVDGQVEQVVDDGVPQAQARECVQDVGDAAAVHLEGRRSEHCKFRASAMPKLSTSIRIGSSEHYYTYGM